MSLPTPWPPGDPRAVAPRVWRLNFDGEEELAAGALGSKAPEPPLAALEVAAERLGATGWLRPCDQVLGVHTDAIPRDAVGLAWCPTPTAQERLRELGLGPGRVAPAPGAGALTSANRREGFWHLPALPGSMVCSSWPALQEAVQRRAPTRPSGRPPAWLLRHSLCAAGRGRFLAESVDAPLEAWSQRALSLGPVHVIPMLDLEEEVSLHAWLAPSGEVQRGVAVTQRVKGYAWRSAVRRPEPILALGQALTHVLERLATLGYFGPVGVDGFYWRDARGALQFAAGTDVNARYTMSMAVGFSAPA